MTQHHAEHSGVMMEGAAHRWKDEVLVAQFVDHTTAQAEVRRVQFDFACDLFPFEPDADIRVLDIGAGYGAFAEAVLDRFPNAIAVGLDLSEPMMAVGRERMARFGSRFAYHVGDFAEGSLPADLPGPFDAVVASAAILHLPRAAKQQLCAEVFRVLKPGGCFFSVDQVAPANEEMQAWNQEWQERERRRGDQPELPHPHALMPHHHVETEAAHEQHQRYHHLETEADHLAFLRAAGFVQVDCFYKRLLQAVIGGYKPSRSVV